MAQPIIEKRVREQIFADPQQENYICTAGTKYMNRFLESGRLGKAFAVLSDCSVYCKGRFLVQKKGAPPAKRLAEYRVDIPEISSVKHVRTHHSWLLVLVDVQLFFHGVDDERGERDESQSADLDQQSDDSLPESAPLRPGVGEDEHGDAGGRRRREQRLDEPRRGPVTRGGGQRQKDRPGHYDPDEDQSDELAYVHRPPDLRATARSAALTCVETLVFAGGFLCFVAYCIAFVVLQRYFSFV